MTIPTPTSQYPMQISSRNVAVIGAGAAGLVTARELRREGHNVVIFERELKVGGTWVYNPTTESDLLGLNPNRTVVHSSLYASLRTNIPREEMGFQDYPFGPTDKPHRDRRRFPGHREVLDYLNDFAGRFKLRELVRFGTEVRNVESVEVGKWKVSLRKRDKDHVDDEVYDAVVICVGHYTQPRLAEIPGIDVWPGKQIHSHNYRLPEPFQNQVLVLIGSSASAVDISREVTTVAKEVHIASRSATNEAFGKVTGYDNMWFHPMIKSVHEDGTLIFHDGIAIRADTIIYCTGYKYHYPFLQTSGIVTVDDNRVGPLYKHIFSPFLAPWLSFVGLPYRVVPFPMFELQSKWIAGVLSGRISLPSPEEMMKDVENFYASLEASGIPKHYTHNIANYQFEYDDWLAAESGCAPIEEWRKQMYVACRKNRMIRPETYRDEWEDQHLVLQAYEDFNSCSS